MVWGEGTDVVDVLSLQHPFWRFNLFVTNSSGFFAEEYRPDDGLPGNVHSIVEASTQAWTAPIESDAEAALNSLISLILMMPPDRVKITWARCCRLLRDDSASFNSKHDCCYHNALVSFAADWKYGHHILREDTEGDSNRQESPPSSPSFIQSFLQVLLHNGYFKGSKKKGNYLSIEWWLMSPARLRRGVKWTS